ncbi:site-specific integrase [Prescottella soli]|uniref:Site-specific integrase n=1 Tax=Prescottella soli TaxID=1543852 RepID=A0ABW9G1F3_9NOCA
MQQCDIDPGQQLITLVRKGTRAKQPVPESADAFVWLRLHQEEMHGEVPRGRTQPVWWTLRRPRRPLNYPAAHRMFARANAAVGSDWTLHDLRHSAAARIARDPQLMLSDVQLVLGHAHLSTTEIYLTPDKDEVIAGVLALHARIAEQREKLVPPPPSPGYDPQALSVLFGRML